MVHFDNTFVFQNLLKDEAVLKTQSFSSASSYNPSSFFISRTRSYNSFSFFLFPEAALTIPFPAYKFPKKLAPKVPNNILKNLPFCSFDSFLIVLVTPFSEILESSRVWIIFFMSFISSFEIIKVVVPEPCIFFWIPASIAEAAAVIPNGARKHFLLKGLLLSLVDLLIYSIMILKILQIELF